MDQWDHIGLSPHTQCLSDDLHGKASEGLERPAWVHCKKTEPNRLFGLQASNLQEEANSTQLFV